MQRAVETTAYFSRGNDKSVLVGETLASAAHSFEWNTTTRIFYQNGPESILERVLGCRSFSCNMKYLKIEIVFKKRDRKRTFFFFFYLHTRRKRVHRRTSQWSSFLSWIHTVWFAVSCCCPRKLNTIRHPDGFLYEWICRPPAPDQTLIQSKRFWINSPQSCWKEF